MRRVIWLLLVLIVSVWLGLQIAKDPGSVILSYRHWSVTMPLWFALLGLILGLFLLHLIWSLLNGIDSTLYRLGNWLRWRRRSQSYSKTNLGLIELIEGHWTKAENYLIAGISRSDAPLINYLALAKAAHEQTQYDKRDSYLGKAHAVSNKAEIAVGLVQAQFQISQGQYEKALATLSRLHTLAPQHKLVLKLLERVYVHLADWLSLLKLLPSLYKSTAITNEQLLMLQKNVYSELLQSTLNQPDGLASLDKVWSSVPRRLQKDPQLLGCYAQQLAHYPAQAVKAIELLGKSLKKSWNTRLVKLYGEINADDSVKQLGQAESWLKFYPQQAVLFLTLARLSLRCQLWGKACSYFEESLKLDRSAVTCLEYGKLLEQLGDSAAAMQIYREGLVG